ncbi:MAG: ribosome biogenesis GTP-binding protein YihA/YsxC [Candidatus Gracilibacteria bacterium]|nr:ribosome biogenesis GTP-binding protein YihA/YsxC [Candidatus Gracilibacteria bacterium]
MKNLEVSFDKSISIESVKVSFDNKKQIVFVGRSNVGKSSLMNAIFQKRDLVKTSSLPGKTKLANLFKVNNKYHFVDLPGYGFAKLGQIQKEKLDALISWYLEEFRYDIKKIVIVLDSKIGPTETDIDMFKFLGELQIPLIFVLNKIDKLSNNEIAKSKFHTEELFFGQRVVCVSAKNNIGIDLLRKELMETFK